MKEVKFAMSNLDRSSRSSNLAELPSLFREETHRRIIEECMGPLSKDKSRQKIPNKQIKNRNFSHKLPMLGNPGSPMGNPLETNTSNVIGTVNLEPMANAEELISLNPMNQYYDENYQKIRVFFMLSTFICIIIILFESVAIILGISYTNCCQMVDVFLIISGCFHVVIILLEWVKSWIWSPSDNPVVPDSNSDHMQIIISCILICLYALSIVWFTVGFAWIPNVFANFLKQGNNTVGEVTVIQNNVVYTQHVPQCSRNFYVFALSYQVIIGLLFLLRMVLCCMSNFCKGLCNKFATHTTDGNFEMYSENPLNEILPPLRNPLFKFGYNSEKNTTGLHALFSVNQLNMITPIPMYPSDKNNMGPNTFDPILKHI